MKLDETIIRSIKVTKEKIREYKPIDFSEEEILEVVDSQIKGMAFGLKKGVSVRLPLIGRFLFNDTTKTKRLIHEFIKLKDFYSEIEYNQMDLEARIKTIKRNKARWREERKNKLTVVELIKKPNITNGHILYDKLTKLLSKEEIEEKERLEEEKREESNQWFKKHLNGR